MNTWLSKWPSKWPNKWIYAAILGLCMLAMSWQGQHAAGAENAAADAVNGSTYQQNGG
jgi:hypothetical protein